MSGEKKVAAKIVKMPRKSDKPEIVDLTPEKAMELLEHNTHNRPLSDVHVQRIARQIIHDKWRFNGDTIKVAINGDVLDGQHRLWAIIEAKRAVKTVIVYKIERDAFATIDTVRRLRTGGDVLALNDVTRYRTTVSTALTWLLRWQRGVLLNWKAPINRIENSDIEEANRNHPNIIQAVERATKLRRLVNPGVLGFLYYVISNRNVELAERMMDTLENPARVSLYDPFYKLRSYFEADSQRRKDAVMTIALTIKAANAAYANKDIQALSWRRQGDHPEALPALDF